MTESANSSESRPDIVSAALGTWQQIAQLYRDVATALAASPPNMDEAEAASASAEALAAALPEPAAFATASAGDVGAIQAAIAAAQTAHAQIAATAKQALQQLTSAAGHMTTTQRKLQGYAGAGEPQTARYVDTQR